MDKRTLTVIGHSQIQAKVDTIVLSLHIRKKDKDYMSLLEKLNSLTLKLKDVVKNLDIKESNLTTENYFIEEVTKQVKDANGNYTSVSDGYQACLDSQLRIPFYNSLLLKALHELSSIQCEISLSYEVRDKKSYEELALRKASEDAFQKAKIIADASRVKLKGILSINYQSGSFDGVEGSYPVSLTRGVRMTSMDINPKDEVVKENITVTYEIEDISL